ncbi:hypothetical protein A33Q_0294 [Indibacter alkaliphilus LW1]|uniref:Uncharacterized protein n=1 Tax=Indibacter alkaliphilus (strain CCUG 57479 / KCTC 22604 / LW1) TaxID=1189612 RepID=S2EBA5_INDAL|nr:hypothetical protein A33Q_0294 [Indibacter alkaliphilus LW1]
MVKRVAPLQTQNDGTATNFLYKYFGCRYPADWNQMKILKILFC